MQKAGSAKRTVAEMALIKLCDTSLDTSPDALLSRISKLENAIASGAAFRTSVPKEALTQDNNDDTPVSNEDIKTVKKEQPIANVADAPALKILRGWTEMAEKAAAGDGAVLGFLKTGKAFVAPDGKVYIKFPNAFAKMMVEGAGLRDSIRAAISISAHRDIDDTQLIFDLLEGDEVLTDLDELDITE